eukprot:354784-Chlamydomonas_euryale.AAC.4
MALPTTNDRLTAPHIRRRSQEPPSPMVRLHAPAPSLLPCTHQAHTSSLPALPSRPPRAPALRQLGAQLAHQQRVVFARHSVEHHAEYLRPVVQKQLRGAAEKRQAGDGILRRACGRAMSRSKNSCAEQRKSSRQGKHARSGVRVSLGSRQCWHQGRQGRLACGVAEPAGI